MTSQPTEPPGAVLLDIDGTLVDSNYLHVHAWVRAFAEVGRPADAWRVHRCIGMGSDLLVAEILGDDDAEVLSDDVLELHTAHYAELAPLLRPFDGARELVRVVTERGAAAVLATSAAPDEVERLRAVLRLDDVVAGITGDEDVEDAKPEPDLVEAALRLARVPPERALMLGDAVWDVQAAARAGVGCVGLLSGGTSRAELRSAGAIAVYDDAADLLARLDESPLAALWTDAR